MNIDKVELITKLADYEAEIIELENIINISNPEKLPLYKKELTALKSKYTKIKNQLEFLYKGDDSDEE